MRRAFFLLRSCLAVGFLCALGAAPSPAQRTEPVIADHTSADLSLVPDGCVEQAKGMFRISYGHTSHGSQIVSGMEVIRNQSSLYDYNNDGSNGALSFHDCDPLFQDALDLGNPNRTLWAQRTRELLETPGNDRNLIMWSWCGEVSSATEQDIDTYLGLMSQLETDFPDVIFVYMTGHLDGSGEAGNLNIRNNQIRDFCRANNKVLFDFADIESYDPDGSYFLDLNANDNCDYSGGNWAQEWCALHPGECATCSCAHSQCLNCQVKGRVFWWMMARLAGGDDACRMPVERLILTRDGSDVVMSWDPDLGSIYGYNGWYVTAKPLIDEARLSGLPAAVGVAGCAAPQPAAEPSCTDVGAVLRDMNVPYFYQIRTHCCGAQEGP